MGAFLSALGLKPSKAMLQRAAAAAPPEEAEAAAPAEGMLGAYEAGSVAGVELGEREGGAKGKKAPPADAATRQQATAALGALEAKYDRLYAVRRQMAENAAAKKKEAEKAPAPARAALDKVVRQYTEAIGKADERLALVRKSIDAVGDPTASHEDLVRALALARSKDDAPAVATKAVTPGGNGLDRARKVVETEYRDGTARIDTEEEGFVVDKDGLKHKDVSSREVVDGDGSVKSTRSKTTTLGPDGLKQTQETKTEFTARDGAATKSWSSSTKDEKSVGVDGVKLSREVKVESADGSSRTDKHEKAVVRGDGRLGVKEGTSRETVDADGNTFGTSSEATTGITADGKSMGTFADASGQASAKHKSGAELSGGLKLKANVKCTIGDPKGDPPMYPVSIEVNCGAEFTIGGGGGGEPEVGGSKVKAKAGLEVKLGAEYVFRQTRNLPAYELDAYIAAMNGANAGSSIDATYRELAIIHKGATEGWEAAQRLAKGQGPLSPEMLAALRNEGDSVELAGSTQAGAGAKLNVRVVELEGSAERKNEKSVKATKRADQKIGVQGKQAQTDKLAGKAGLNYAGIGGASAGRAHEWKTGFGFDVVVDPQKDADGQAMAALAACKGKDDFDRAIARYKDRLTVRSTTTSKGESDKTEVGVNVLGAKAAIGTGNALSEEEQRDASGKVIGKTTVGEQQAGGGVELPGGIKYGDQSQNKAVARTDAKGNASLELSKKQSQSRIGRIADALEAKGRNALGLDDADPKAPAKGLAQRAAGGGEVPDTQVHDVYGIRLTKADLEKIGQRAKSDSTWPSPWKSSEKDIADWRGAQRAINASGGKPEVVAHELSAFVGKSPKDRVGQLRHFLRPGGDVSIGAAFAFPDGMKQEQADYEELVAGECEQKVYELAKNDPPAAAKLGHELMTRLTQLTFRIKNAQIGDKAAQADMSSQCGRRRTALAEAIRVVEGRNSEADIKAEKQQEFNRHVGNCQTARRNLDEALAPLQALRADKPRAPQGTKNDYLADVKSMLDLRAILRAELAAAKKLADEYGFPAQRYEQFRADDNAIDDLKSWYGMSRSN